MSTSESRTEVMKPLLIKAAIPTALSVAAYLCAKVISRLSKSQQSIPEHKDESFHSLDSAPPECPESEDQKGTSLQDVREANLQDKVLNPEIQVEDLQERELDWEARFRHYRSLKEKEFMLTEMRNLMMMEKTRAECLLKEISLMEEENKRMGELVIDHINLTQKIESLKMENGLLKRKERKHWRIAKLRLRILRKQKVDIEARDAELVRNRQELEELEDKVAQLKVAVDHLQRVKIESFNKRDLAEKLSESSNPEIEIGILKGHEKVLQELQQLQKDRDEKAKQVPYSGSNDCLRYELLRCHEQSDSQHDSQAREPGQEGSTEPRINGDIHDCNCRPSGHEDEHCFCTALGNSTTCHVHSRRRRLIQKFKRWVEGGKHEGKEKAEMRSLGEISAHEEANYDQVAHARKSCSSV